MHNQDHESVKLGVEGSVCGECALNHAESCGCANEHLEQMMVQNMRNMEQVSEAKAEFGVAEARSFHAWRTRGCSEALRGWRRRGERERGVDELALRRREGCISFLCESVAFLPPGRFLGSFLRGNWESEYSRLRRYGLGVRD